MDWLLVNPHIYSAFTALGTMSDGGYVVGDNCLEFLQGIHIKLSTEDHRLRTFRRAIGFGNNIKNDIVPLLVNAKDTDLIHEVITLLVNLTIPVECLMSVEVMRRTEIGRHTIYDLTNLLVSAKEAFANPLATKTLVNRMQMIFDSEATLSVVDCGKINHCLVLLRNILHVSEGQLNEDTSLQNRIIWNLFTQSIDKLILHIINSEQCEFWAVTVTQLIALLYKDQHVNTMQKLLNVWFEASLSESSEDDYESSSSLSMQFRGGSSPMLTSEPTSDSSDIGDSTLSSPNKSKLQKLKGNCFRKPAPNTSDGKQDTHTIESQNSLDEEMPRDMQSPPRKDSGATETSITQLSSSGFGSMEEQSMSDSDQQMMDASPIVANNNNYGANTITTGNNGDGTVVQGKKHKTGSSTINKTKEKKMQIKLELPDWGEEAQADNQDSISTSSNEVAYKPVHHKPPPNQKQRYNAANNPRKPVTAEEKRDLRRKKLARRGSSSIIKMKGILHHSPTDKDITNVLKEFTVDFLLKGYGVLVKRLYTQHLKNLTFKIDTSHFFWLITNFLKFGSQLDLEFDLIKPVISFEILSYLTYEGISLSESLELEGKLNGPDLETQHRRLHFVITAVREILQALSQYNKSSHLSQKDKDYVQELRLRVAKIQDIRCMFVLLIRCYNPFVQKKQYLQDLVTTNHILLSLIDDVGKSPEFDGFSKHSSIIDHIRQFATVEIMHHYGLLLENFRENGEFVNDCIFTMMHHVGGDLGQASVLFQPGILKTFSNIWDSDYSICEDWSDLIEYVIHKFINTPQQAPLSLPNPIIVQPVVNIADQKRITWAKEEMDRLYWYYIHCKTHNDIVGSIIKQFKVNTNRNKSRIDVIQQLLRQDIISLSEFDDLMVFEDSQYVRTATPALSKVADDEKSSPPIDDIKRLINRLVTENKENIIYWLQGVLMECCYIKLKLYPAEKSLKDKKQTIMEPIPLHYILKNQPVPIVPWNSEQHSMMLYQPFIVLLHKLGFLLPDDSNRLWICVPNSWTAEILFSVANKLGSIDNSLFKFDNSYFDDIGNFTKNDEITIKEEPSESMETYLTPMHQISSPIIKYTPEPFPKPQWLEVLIRAKEMSANGLLHFDNEDLNNKALLDTEQLATVMNPIFHPCVPNKIKSPKIQRLQSLERIVEPPHEDMEAISQLTTETDPDQLLRCNESEIVCASEVDYV